MAQENLGGGASEGEAPPLPTIGLGVVPALRKTEVKAKLDSSTSPPEHAYNR